MTSDRFITNRNQDGDIIISVNGTTEVMRIDGYTGRVGIGTSSPSSKLSVIGDAYVSGNLSAVTALKADTLNEYTSSNGVQIRGRTSGTAIAAGYVGEMLGTVSNFTNAKTSMYSSSVQPNFNTTLITIPMTPGVWLISVSVVAATGGLGYALSGAITDSSGNTIFSQNQSNSYSPSTGSDYLAVSLVVPITITANTNILIKGSNSDTNSNYLAARVGFTRAFVVRIA